MSGPSPSAPGRRFEPVIAVSGHLVDRPDRAQPRFPAAAVPAVTAAIAAAFEGWSVGPGALVLTAGARGADIIAAELAVDRGAAVWLLLPLPDEELLAASVALDGTDWADRYRSLRRRCPTWFLADQLDRPARGDEVFARNNEWCVATAAAAAPAGRWRALVVWDGQPGDGPGGTADFVERARVSGAEVEVIPPVPAAESGPG